MVAITGATSGIGREAARLLVKEGPRVAIGGRRRDRLADVVDELAEMIDTNYAGTATEFAVGAGRTEDDPRFAGWLTAGDVAAAVVTTLQQLRSLRTGVWTLWTLGQASRPAAVVRDAGPGRVAAHWRRP